MKSFSKAELTLGNAANGQEIIVTGDDIEKPLIFQVVTALKQSEVSEVLHVTLDGKDLILKRYLGKNPDNTVRSFMSQVARLDPSMATGPLRINRCIYAFPGIGVVVLEFIPGENIGKMLSGNDAELRSKMLLNCGLWLKKFGGDDYTLSRFSPQFWLKRLDRRKPDLIAKPVDRDLLDALRQNLNRRAAKIAGVRAIKGPTHDDFIPANLLFHNDILYGIDIQSETILPFAKASAQLLVLLQFKRPNSDTDLTHGVSRKDYQDFLKSGILPSSEYNTILPFFLAEQFYFRLQNAIEKDMPDPHIRQAVTRFLNS
ncbi:MAG: aminoglycoside phosphotransferase family protein [Rhodobacteraceae bacterium]|nr:aminoglycoside phosphotransferase family protein [Paracoccaceae bacterium]